MGRREDARQEAAFARGSVGVDGAATEEKQDEVELERGKARDQLLRGRTWLGREFLTWLLWRSEGTDPVGKHGGEDLSVVFMGRVVLRGLHGDVVELSAKGTLAPYSEQVRRALDQGLLVHAGRLRFTAGERSWDASLDAEFLDLRAAKLPELLTEEEDDRLTERLDLVDQLSSMLDQLLDAFLALRASKRWSAETVPALKRWMQGAGSKPLERARRAS